MVNVTERPERYVIQRLLYEVYRTDEDNWVPYEPFTSYEDMDSRDDEEEPDPEEAEEEPITGEEEEEEDDLGFPLHRGEIIDTYYYGDFTSATVESDYEEITDTGSIEQPAIEDLDRLYKGVRTRIRSAWDDGKLRDLKTMPSALLGFITDESWTENGMQFGISGMTKLLEPEYRFEFSQMLRSDIIKEVIKTAGLKPVVDPTGLDDQLMDYTNVSGNEEESDTDTSDLPADACAAAKKIVKNKKKDKTKAEAIYNWINTNCPYKYYQNSRYTEQNVYSVAIKHRGQAMFNCCDHAHLSVVMLRCVGLKANYIHVPNHVYAVVYIDGQRVMFDPLGYSRGMGTVASGYAKDGTETESLSF